MRMKCWQENQGARTIATGDGFVKVNGGDIVVVAVISSWSDFAKIFGTMLEPKEPDAKPDPG